MGTVECWVISGRSFAPGAGLPGRRYSGNNLLHESVRSAVFQHLFVLEILPQGFFSLPLSVTDQSWRDLPDEGMWTGVTSAVGTDVISI